MHIGKIGKPETIGEPPIVVGYHDVVPHSLTFNKQWPCAFGVRQIARYYPAGLAVSNINHSPGKHLVGCFRPHVTALFIIKKHGEFYALIRKCIGDTENIIRVGIAYHTKTGVKRSSQLVVSNQQAAVNIAKHPVSV